MCPIELGCDLVVQSLTKYYDGHNMTVGGAVVTRTTELLDQIQFSLNMHGNAMSPNTSFLIMQTMKTMELRVRRQCETAFKVATMLEAHKQVGSLLLVTLFGLFLASLMGSEWIERLKFAHV
jgi:cystathionine beta-lyase/cystathionine gamma-synthase